MTLYGLIASLVWAGLVLYALTRLLPMLEQWVDARLSLTDTPQAPAAMPPDLVAFTNQFASEWARADALKTVRERYEQTKDWNHVRRAVGLGSLSTE